MQNNTNSTLHDSNNSYITASVAPGDLLRAPRERDALADQDVHRDGPAA